ncbi:MAG: hypothetical protein K6E91_14650 [Butyrivibrio sp.]|nr:hypothetical protein [Butyrivibrio sp.]
MRIYTLKGKEKDSFVKALPDDTDLSDSLIIVSEDDEAEDSPVVGLMVLSVSAPAAWSLDYLMVADSYRLRGVAKSLISYGNFLYR